MFIFIYNLNPVDWLLLLKNGLILKVIISIIISKKLGIFINFTIFLFFIINIFYNYYNVYNIYNYYFIIMFKYKLIIFLDNIMIISFEFIQNLEILLFLKLVNKIF